MENLTTPTTRPLGLLRFGQYIDFMAICCGMFIVISLTGVVLNVINIKTFISMRLQDGVTVSFLVLSLSDVGVVLDTLAFGLCQALYIIEERHGAVFPVDPFGLTLFLAYAGIILNVFTDFITSFLAVTRCLCVVKPLQFKSAFSRSLSLIILTGFFLLAVVSMTPVLANMGMMLQFDKRVNTTRPMLWVSPGREFVKNIMHSITNIVLPITAQIIIAISVLLIGSGLKKAFRFRQAAMSLNTEETDDVGTVQCKDQGNRHEKDYKSKSSKKSRLSDRDVHIFQQVTLISVMYLICNSPKILAVVAGNLIPELAIGKQFEYTYRSVNNIRGLFYAINSTANFFIYYKYNSRFRSLCTFGHRRQP